MFRNVFLLWAVGAGGGCCWQGPQMTPVSNGLMSLLHDDHVRTVGNGGALIPDSRLYKRSQTPTNWQMCVVGQNPGSPFGTVPLDMWNDGDPIGPHRLSPGFCSPPPPPSYVWANPCLRTAVLAGTPSCLHTHLGATTRAPPVLLAGCGQLEFMYPRPPCASTGWALNSCVGGFFGPQFLRSQRFSFGVCGPLVKGKRGSAMPATVPPVHNNILPHIAAQCCLM